MALTNRQKKIVNPFATTLSSPERTGVGYDYNNAENRFVIDAIHEKYLFFYEFPQIGTTLRGFNRDPNTITREDLLAYFSLYPQNGKLVDDVPTEISSDEAEQILEVIASALKSAGALEKYSTQTTELTFDEEKRNSDIANLIAIPQTHSKQYKDKIRFALSLPEVEYSEQETQTIQNINPEVATYVNSDTNLDLYDWRNNGLPGEDNDRVYYNPVDQHYYYVRRTSETNDKAYAFNNLRSTAKRSSVSAAIAAWTRYSEESKQRYIFSLQNGIREILKLTGRNSQQNFDKLSQKLIPPTSYANINGDLKVSDSFPLLTYKDLRPGSRWIYALKIKATDISSLEMSPASDRLGDLRPSFEEYEISSIQKAQRLVGKENQTFTSVSFLVTDMIRYLLPVRSLLREIGGTLFDEGLTPDVLDGIDLGREATRLESFFELLELFCNYNKIALEDDDLVEIFFTSNYLIDHIAINGNFYYQGCGANKYLNIANEVTRVVNAFSLFTPTTFSILRNAYLIYNEAQNQNSSTINPLDFVSKYVFPKPDVGALRLQRIKSRSSRKNISIKRKNVFTKLSKLSKTSPQQYERLFSTRQKKYRISHVLNSINCDTGQLKSAKYALKFWTAANSKTRVRSLLRETIILLRQEVVEDEYARRALAVAETGVNTPGAAITGSAAAITGSIAAGNQLLGMVEKEINSQIFCSLDVLGDFIEDQFLDPLGLPPETKTLTRKSLGESSPTVQLSLKPMVSTKSRQSEIYQKAIETIMLNFLKSILAGVITDILNALFGCGPNSGRGENATLRSSLNVVDFGSATLDSSFFDVDVVDVAKQVKLQDVQTQIINEQRVTVKNPATLDQLQAFLEDTAKMCTPFELQQLLDGDAEYQLLQHILETVTGQQTIIKYNIDPDKYNTLNFTADKIKNFFITIGDYISEIVDEDPNLSPLAAYCDTGEETASFIDDLDIADIEEQYSELVQDKLAKINSLCDALRSFANIQVQIERLIENLPSMQWYDDLLQFVADLSNFLADSFSKLFEGLFDKDQEKMVRQLAEYNMYSSELGTQLFFQIFFSMRELPINQFYYDDRVNETGFLTPAGWNPRRVGWGFNQGIDGDEINFRGNFGSRKNDFTEDQVYKFIWSDTRDPEGESRGRVIEPSRLDIPQYRGYPQRPNESWDAAYYSLKNSPSGLLKRLRVNPNRVTAQQLGRIQYGQRVREDDEQLYLSTVAKRVYTYLTAEEILSPYNSWTGATFLACGAPGFPNDKITVSYYKPEDEIQVLAQYDPTDNLVNTEVSSSLYYSEINGEYAPVDYRIFAGTNINGHSVSYNERRHLVVDGVIMPTNESLGVRNLYSNFSIGVPKVNYTDRQSPSSRTRSNGRDEDVLCIQNYRSRIDETINNTIISDRGRQRFPRYMTSLAKNPLSRSNDICVTPEEVSKADGLRQSLQSRLSMFFLNILPLAPSYPNWGSVGTVKLIVDYLHRKISEDYKRKEILGSAYELIKHVSVVYPYSPDEKFLSNPRIFEFNTPSENLKNIIEALYLGILTNVQETSEYSQVRKSAFDNSTSTAERYRNTLLKFYRILGDDNTSLVSYGIAAENQDAARQKIREFYNDEGVTDLGLSVGVYYFPISFQIASYMIYYNEGIRFANRFSDTNLRFLLDIATSDDAMLTAIKGQIVRRFTEGFTGFPISIDTWDMVREITYYSPEQVQDRINTLSQILDNYDYFIENSVGLYDLSSYVDFFQQEGFSIQQIFSSYFSSDVDGITFANGSILMSPRRWVSNVRDETINQINQWFTNWIGPDEPVPGPIQIATLAQLRAQETILENQTRGLGDLAPANLVRDLENVRRRIRETIEAGTRPDFSYNRSLATSERRAGDANLNTLRDAEDIWIRILENNYRTVEVDILTPSEYFTTVSSYFATVSNRFYELYELEVAQWVEDDNELLPRNRGMAPAGIKALEEAGLFFLYLATTYGTGGDIAPKVLEEKTTLERLITTNE